MSFFGLVLEANVRCLFISSQNTKLKIETFLMQFSNSVNATAISSCWKFYTK